MAHAKFSPSNSGRWLNCTASMTLPTKPSRGTSHYANRGTSLHALSEDILNGLELKKVYNDYRWTEDDLNLTVIPYVEYVKALPQDEKFIEVKVKLTDECFGTADFISYDAETKTLHVADFKAGQGVMVYVNGNTQMMIYAIGAIKKFKDQFDIEKVTIHVVQPGINNIASLDVTLVELDDLFKRVKQTIKNVNKGEVEFKPGDDACRWCPHKLNCPKLNEIATQIAMDDFKGVELSEKLKLVAPIKHFIKQIEEEANEYISQGKTIEGFKLIRGRGNRSWVNENLITDAVVKYVSENKELDLKAFTEPKLITVAQLEKEIKRKKADFNIDPYVVRGESAPKLVPEDDPRKPIDKLEEAKKDFE